MNVPNKRKAVYRIRPCRRGRFISSRTYGHLAPLPASPVGNDLGSVNERLAL
jgi:hypothetical protein